MMETELSAGDVLGRYELLLPIAKGGMAQVWAARLQGTRGFRKIVAIKTILRGQVDDARMEQMFLEEASLASQIHHPNVVETLDLGEQDGTLYLVMEWVDGEPLHFILAHAQQQGGLPLPIAVNIIGQACKGLHAAHELRDEHGELLGLVHRDISPQNLLVAFSGTTKLVDFGIAKATTRSASLTNAGELKGKFAYMSPEQVSGGRIDRRSDVFALGVLLYMLTTGRHPFKGDHPGETVKNVCSEQPARPPRKFVSDYPPALEAVVLKALQKAPADRYATAHELLAALEEALPDYLEGSFESEVGRYLKDLLGPRIGERRRELRLAEERRDGMRISTTDIGPPPASYGSLGAVAMEAPGGPSSSSRLATIVDAPDVSPPRPKPLASRRVLLVAAVPLALVLGAALGYQRLAEPAASTASAAAAASPVPPTVFKTVAPRAVVEPNSARDPVAPSGVVPSASSAAVGPADLATAGPRLRAPTTPRTTTPTLTARPPLAAPESPRAPNGSPSGRVESISPPVVSAVPNPRTTPAPQNRGVNAWDPATFGGRH